MAEREIDAALAEAFGERALGIVNDGFLTLALSIGHRTGLFDTMAELPPSTSAKIAEAAGLQPRYVREWLGAVVTGRIVDYDPGSGTYTLPAEHAACLTRAAGADNLASFGTILPLMSKVEDLLIEAFRHGGGVPYAAFDRFQELQAEESAHIFDAAMVDGIVPLVPGLRERLEAGIDVLDVGCGQGHGMNVLARAFPASRFAGYDFSEEGIAAARAEAHELGLRNVRFEERDVNRLGEPASWDLITAFDVIHDLARPRDALRGIAAGLRPGGQFLMVDVAASSNLEDNMDHPLTPALYVVSLAHCMTVSLSQDGEGLGTMWGEQKALELLAEAGFDRVEVARVEGDVFNNYYIARRR